MFRKYLEKMSLDMGIYVALYVHLDYKCLGRDSHFKVLLDFLFNLSCLHRNPKFSFEFGIEQNKKI